MLATTISSIPRPVAAMPMDYLRATLNLNPPIGMNVTVATSMTSIPVGISMSPAVATSIGSNTMGVPMTNASLYMNGASTMRMNNASLHMNGASTMPMNNASLHMNGASTMPMNNASLHMNGASTMPMNNASLHMNSGVAPVHINSGHHLPMNGTPIHLNGTHMTMNGMAAPLANHVILNGTMPLVMNSIPAPMVMNGLNGNMMPGLIPAAAMMPYDLNSWATGTVRPIQAPIRPYIPQDVNGMGMNLGAHPMIQMQPVNLSPQVMGLMSLPPHCMDSHTSIPSPVFPMHSVPPHLQKIPLPTLSQPINPPTAPSIKVKTPVDMENRKYEVFKLQDFIFLV
jgi:hypothetical protein